VAIVRRTHQRRDLRNRGRTGRLRRFGAAPAEWLSDLVDQADELWTTALFCDGDEEPMPC
jgi:hypothetical protein